jgi:hypothetical protein
MQLMETKGILKFILGVAKAIQAALVRVEPMMSEVKDGNSA